MAGTDDHARAARTAAESTSVEDAAHRSRWDSTDEPIVVDVVETVSAATGRDPLDLPPLGTRVDPEALNALFDEAGSDPDAGTSVSFRYAGRAVTVSATGEVVVHDSA